MRGLLALLLWAMAAPALAASNPAALFADGEFAAAADHARMREDDPGSLALAARAALVVAAYEIGEEDKALTLIDEAVRDADRALGLSPRHVEALVHKAIALGYRAQLRASPGDAKRSLALMHRAAALAPENPLVWAAIGGWHAEAVAELGRFLAGVMLGANRADSIAAYERAMGADPANPIWRTFYAISLVGMGYGDDEARLRAILLPATRAQATGAFERMMQVRARRLLAALGDEEALARSAQQARPFASFR